MAVGVPITIVRSGAMSFTSNCSGKIEWWRRQKGTVPLYEVFISKGPEPSQPFAILLMHLDRDILCVSISSSRLPWGPKFLVTQKVPKFESPNCRRSQQGRLADLKENILITNFDATTTRDGALLCTIWTGGLADRRQYSRISEPSSKFSHTEGSEIRESQLPPIPTRRIGGLAISSSSDPRNTERPPSVCHSVPHSAGRYVGVCRGTLGG